MIEVLLFVMGSGISYMYTNNNKQKKQQKKDNKKIDLLK